MPVGDDQMPHIEVTRDLARRFNALYGSIFPEPRGLLSEMPRLPGLDGRTMHNSYGNTIPLSAPAGEVAARIRRMITDPGRVHSHDPGTPQVCAAFAYYSAFLPGLAGTIDPLAGSYYVESLTNEIEKRAQAYLEKIDAMGGMLKAIESGYIGREIQESSVRYQRAVDSGEKVIVGLNRFQEQGEDTGQMDLFQVDPAVEVRQKGKLASLRATRSRGAVDAELAELAAVIARKENVMPVVIRAVKAYATVGEIAGVMRRAWGEYRGPTTI